VPVKRNVDILLGVPDAVLARTVCGTRHSVEAIIRIRILLLCLALGGHFVRPSHGAAA